jgi:purine-cytosine permease-like protein
MEDLARIVMIMFAGWIASGVALAGLAWLAPVTWGRTLRLTLMIVAAAAFVLLTGALFGIKMGATAALPAALIVYVGLKRG